MMAIRALSEAEFKSTVISPVRRLSPEDEPPPARGMKSYVAEVIATERLPTTLEAIQIHHVYVPHGDRHTHVLFNFGEPNHYLVIVIDNHAANVMGHHLLDLNEVYGLK
jgi:hypothetical protein